MKNADNNTDNYYKGELNKLVNSEVYLNTIQIHDSLGNKTKFMNLNVECIDEVIYYLQGLRELEVKKRSL